MTASAQRPDFVAQLGVELARLEREAAQRRRPRVRPRALALAAAASFVAVAGAGAATGVLPLPGGGPQFAASDATGRFSAALARDVTVLTRPRTLADAMGDAAGFVTGSGSPAPGSSLRVAVPPPAEGTPHASAVTLPVWLLPTSDGDVSMQVLPPGADGPASGFAADDRMVREGHARMSVGDDLIGLAPDGVDRVELTLADGTRIGLPVVQNVYGAHLDEPVQNVELPAR